MLIPEEVILADCVLSLPRKDLPFAHAAMSEPLSCIISAQDHHLHLVQNDPLSPRSAVKGLKENGVTVVIGVGAMGRMHIDLAFNYRPRILVAADLLPSRLQLVEKHFTQRAENAGTLLYTVNPENESLEEVVAQLTDHRGADDVIVAVGSRSVIESSQHLVGRQGNLNLFGGLKKGDDVIGLDSGIVHYKETVVTGSSGGSPWDVKRTLELMAASELTPDLHISCVGDLDHAPRLLEMVKAQQLGGKAVIYPHRRTGEIRTVDKWTAQDERDYMTKTGA
jgi:L-iditol 2-dehydrogenase